MGQSAGSRRQLVRDEAAAWVVRLAGPASDGADRAAFEAWRDLSSEHEVAYEREAAAWERLDRLQALRPGDAPPDPDLLAPDAGIEVREWRPRSGWTLPRKAAAALIGAAALGSVLAFGFGLGADPAYATAIGERRVIVLDDGSRVELNTNSEIRVRYRAGRREVELVRGEALFDIARDGRPFVVATADARFTAGESELNLRLREDGAAIAVREGAVEAAPAEAGAGRAATITLAAGTGGLIGRDGGRPQPISRDEMSRTLAWQQGAIALDGQPLSEAVAEFNRYNVRKIVVADQAIAGYRLGGYFRTSDIPGFVRALRATFPIRAETGAGGSVRLSRAAAS